MSIVTTRLQDRTAVLTIDNPPANTGHTTQAEALGAGELPAAVRALFEEAAR